MTSELMMPETFHGRANSYTNSFTSKTYGKKSRTSRFLQQAKEQADLWNQARVAEKPLVQSMLITSDTIRDENRGLTWTTFDRTPEKTAEPIKRTLDKLHGRSDSVQYSSGYLNGSPRNPLEEIQERSDRASYNSPGERLSKSGSIRSLFKRDRSPDNSPSSYHSLNFRRSHNSSISISGSLSKNALMSDIKESLKGLSRSPPKSRRSEDNLQNSPLRQRRSLLGFSRQSREFERPIISSPTPHGSSVAKLHDKLKSSSSTLNSSRTSSAGTVAASPEKAEQTEVEKLTDLCNSRIESFEEFANKHAKHMHKFSEASYSDVFIKKDTIYKVVPFGSWENEQPSVQDITQELEIAQLLSSLSGYVELSETHIVQGRYPKELLKKWDEYHQIHGSENIRPDCYGENQLYCVMIMVNGGIDLEHFKLLTWTEALNVLWQIVGYVAAGEKQFSFEHRDLHWGNVLIREQKSENSFSNGISNLDMERAEQLLSELCIEPEEEPTVSKRQLQVTLIDYTLSRATNHNGRIFHTRLDHPSFFRGKGDYQFDVYRIMRKLFLHSDNPTNYHREGSRGNRGHGHHFYSISTFSTASLTSFHTADINWALYRPQTNVLWLHYVADKLLNAKGLSRMINRDNHTELHAFRALQTVARALDPRRKSSSGKHLHACFNDFVNAQSVLAWGVKNNLL